MFWMMGSSAFPQRTSPATEPDSVETHFHSGGYHGEFATPMSALWIAFGTIWLEVNHVSLRKEQHERFGSTPKDPLDDPQFRADLSRIQRRLDREAAEVRERAEAADRNFVEVIEPRKRGYAEALGMTLEDLAKEAKDPLRFQIIATVAMEEGLSFAEARETYNDVLVELMEPLDEAVELAHPVMRSRFGTLVLPKHKRKVVRRLWAREQWPRKTREEIANSPSWRAAVERFRQRKEEGLLYEFEKRSGIRILPDERIARDFQPTQILESTSQNEPQVDDALQPTQLPLWDPNQDLRSDESG